MDEEERRAAQEGLDEETLAMFDLLKKPDLTPGETKRIKAVAIELLATLKAEKLRINHWRDKEATRDVVRAKRSVRGNAGTAQRDNEMRNYTKQMLNYINSLRVCRERKPL